MWQNLVEAAKADVLLKPQPIQPKQLLYSRNSSYTAETAALQPKQFELEMAADNQRNMLHPKSAKLVNVFT